MSKGSSGDPKRPVNVAVQLFRFGLVGVTATLTYLGTSNALIYLVRVDPVLASIAGYVAGMAASFLGQSRYTFQVRRISKRHVSRFVALSIAGLLMSYYGIVWAEAWELAALWGTLGVAVLVPLVSFLTMKLWVFVVTDA